MRSVTPICHWIDDRLMTPHHELLQHTGIKSDLFTCNRLLAKGGTTSSAYYRTLLQRAELDEPRDQIDVAINLKVEGIQTGPDRMYANEGRDIWLVTETPFHSFFRLSSQYLATQEDISQLVKQLDIEDVSQ